MEERKAVNIADAARLLGLHPHTVKALVDDGRLHAVKVGAGGHLYHYLDGVHRFDGRERVEQVCQRVLGERFKPRHAREVVDVLRGGH